jgi:RNA polymerase sigma-B factor
MAERWTELPGVGGSRGGTRRRDAVALRSRAARVRVHDTAMNYDCETSHLWRRRMAGDQAARDELIRRHLPLARKLAARYRSRNEPFDDLVQVANVGLVIAVDRYDPARGRPFRAFAIPTILGELRRHFRDGGWSVHVPRRTQELALRCEQVTREMTALLSRRPRVTELAEYMQISHEDALEGLEAGQAHFAISLDAPIPGASPEADALRDTLGTEDERYASVDTRLDLADGLRRLPPQERRAVTLRISRELKQSEIASQLGCSQMQVSRLLKRAATKLTAAA